jgi:hypothetical protein
MADKIIQARLKEGEYALLEEYCRMRKADGEECRVSSVIRDALFRLIREEFDGQKRSMAISTVQKVISQWCRGRAQ